MTADKERGKAGDEKERRGGSYGMTSSGHKAYKEGDVLAHQQRLENSSRQRLVDGGDADWHGNAAAVGDGSVREEEFEEEGSFASSDGCVYLDNCDTYTAPSSEAQDWMPQQHQWISETSYGSQEQDWIDDDAAHDCAYPNSYPSQHYPNDRNYLANYRSDEHSH